MFDFLNLDITLSDLYDRGLNDDTLVLLKEQTQMSKPVILNKIVAQGDLIAPLAAALQVNSVATAVEKKDEEREVEGRPGLLYGYMDIVPIPILSLMDDCYVISENGYKAHSWFISVVDNNEFCPV